MKLESRPRCPQKKPDKKNCQNPIRFRRLIKRTIMITITLRLTNIIPMYVLIFLLESSANYSTYKLIKESSKCTLTNNTHIQFYYTQTPITSSKINIFQNRAYITLPHTPCELRFEFDCNRTNIHYARCAHPFPPFHIF